MSLPNLSNTTLNTTISGPLNNSACQNRTNLDDINYLLYLESLKRFRDDEQNIRHQVEEKMKKYEIARDTYIDMFAQYVAILKLAATRNALEAEAQQAVGDVGATRKDLATIKELLSSGKVTRYLTEEIVEECKEALRRFNEFENLKNVKKELLDIKEILTDIRHCAQLVELGIGKATWEGTAFFLKEITAGIVPDE